MVIQTVFLLLDEGFSTKSSTYEADVSYLLYFLGRFYSSSVIIFLFVMQFCFPWRSMLVVSAFSSGTAMGRLIATQTKEYMTSRLYYKSDFGPVYSTYIASLLYYPYISN